jgi:DNA-nicking Smr family endonuclease
MRGAARVPLSPSARPAPSRGRPAPAKAAALSVAREAGRVTGASYGVAHDLLHELGSGSLPAEASCDLHGLRAEAARAQLTRFIQSSVAQRRRVVLVICGRGVHSGSTGPVLLDVAVTTLAEPPVAVHVLAFASAAPAQGGEGALLVRLRRARD